MRPFSRQVALFARIREQGFSFKREAYKLSDDFPKASGEKILFLSRFSMRAVEELKSAGRKIILQKLDSSSVTGIYIYARLSFIRGEKKGIYGRLGSEEYRGVIVLLSVRGVP